MYWNVGSPPFNWNEMKWKVYSFFNSGCEMKINEINFSLMTVKWGQMKWIHEISEISNLFRIGNKNTWEGPWEPSKRFIDFYEKSVLLNLSVVQTESDLEIFFLISKTYSSSSSSSRVWTPPWASAHIRISCSEVRQWSVRVTRAHVLHKLAIHPEYDNYVNLLRVCPLEWFHLLQ